MLSGWCGVGRPGGRAPSSVGEGWTCVLGEPAGVWWGGRKGRRPGHTKSHTMTNTKIHQDKTAYITTPTLRYTSIHIKIYQYTNVHQDTNYWYTPRLLTKIHPRHSARYIKTAKYTRTHSKNYKDTPGLTHQEHNPGHTHTHTHTRGW